MSKSIYDEVLEIVNEGLDLPDRSVIFKHTALTEIKKALEKAQKQEKLLELYKSLNNLYEELYTMELSALSLNSNYYEIEIIKLKHQIKELEK